MLCEVNNDFIDGDYTAIVHVYMGIYAILGLVTPNVSIQDNA